MKKRPLISSIATLALIGTPALAADMAVKAPPPAPAPVYSWTGWYGGFNVGGTWSDDPINVNTTTLQFCPVGICGGGAETAAAAAQGTSGVFSGKASGFIGGGQFGYNRQFNNWVAGFEADIQGVASSRASGASNATVALADGSGTVSSNLSATKAIDYLGTVRGRLGWLATPGLLVYGTGGLAYGGVRTSTNATSNLVTGFNCALVVCNNLSTGSSLSQTSAGWTAGGGLEWMWTRQWSVKVEYLYYDLGRATSSSQVADPLNGFAVPNYFVNNVQTSTRFNGNIARVGLNYQFH